MLLKVKIRKSKINKTIKCTIIIKKVILLEIALNLQKTSINLDNLCIDN